MYARGSSPCWTSRRLRQFVSSWHAGTLAATFSSQRSVLQSVAYFGGLKEVLVAQFPGHDLWRASAAQVMEMLTRAVPHDPSWRIDLYKAWRFNFLGPLKVMIA